jgi:hypothetical protein
MSKLLFRPFGIAAGIAAGLIGKRLFQGLWRVDDDAKPPKPGERPAPIGKLALALAFEGALFRLVRGLAEHGSRHAFSRLTGAWPGERAAEAK